jgi:hypothetical protein
LTIFPPNFRLQQCPLKATNNCQCSTTKKKIIIITPTPLAKPPP